jgi:dGTPase
MIIARLFVRGVIEETNIMVIEQTKKNIIKFNIKSVEDVRKTAVDIISAPIKDWHDFLKLKEFLFERVYKSPQVCIMNEKGKLIISRLFGHLEKRPEMLPLSIKERYGRAINKSSKRRVLADYISGMTDRYAMDLYQMMFEPYEKVMFEFRG